MGARARIGPFVLILLPEPFAICNLEPAQPIPAWATVGDFFSITRTVDELSIVCRQDSVPEGIVCEPNWRCLRVAGKFAFGVIGVLAELTTCLAEARISILAVATFDTDYLLIKDKDLAAAVKAFGRQGHMVR
jgi:hypothetical protein